MNRGQSGSISVQYKRGYYIIFGCVILMFAAAYLGNWMLSRGYQSMLDDAVKSGDLKRAEQILTQNGKRRLAHHSDLLTYYDRRGNLVELDDTERHRVLFGDKNIFRL